MAIIAQFPIRSLRSPGIAERSIGRLRLRGKESEIELYALSAAVAETRASGEVTALSARSR
jgi:hypothetical protein